MTLAERLAGLARLQGGAAPVVTAYLNTRWADEHQRDRTRLFLKSAVRKAREVEPAEDLVRALDWIETQAEALVSQAEHPDTHGVALFASPALGLFETIPVRTPFVNTFAVSDRPILRPLAAVAAEGAALVAFVDAESARLIPVSIAGMGDEVRLDSEVPGHHRRGGWAQLAQSRYQRHIEERRGRHFEAVAEALARLADEQGIERIVVAGNGDAVAAFLRELSPRVAARVAGSVPGARYEPAGQLAARALDVVEQRVALETEAALDAVLTDAAKGGQAVAGLEGVLEAVQRGAVDQLYLLGDFRESGGSCAGCGGLQPGDAATCRLCGRPAAATELGEAVVGRVLAAGGMVATVGVHASLAKVGGIAARLRFLL